MEISFDRIVGNVSGGRKRVGRIIAIQIDDLNTTRKFVRLSVSSSIVCELDHTGVSHSLKALSDFRFHIVIIRMKTGQNLLVLVDLVQRELPIQLVDT